MKKIVFIIISLLSNSICGYSNQNIDIIKYVAELHTNKSVVKSTIYDYDWIISDAIKKEIINIKNITVNGNNNFSDSSIAFGRIIFEWSNNTLDTFNIFKIKENVSSINDLQVVYKSIAIGTSQSIIKAFLYSLPAYLSDDLIEKFYIKEFEYLKSM